MKIKPLGDRVLVEALGDEGKKTKGGIIIPDTVSKERGEQGIVIRVGAGRSTDEGKLIPLPVKKGDKIIFSKYGPHELKIDGKDYFIIKRDDILAIYE